MKTLRTNDFLTEAAWAEICTRPRRSATHPLAHYSGTCHCSQTGEDGLLEGIFLKIGFDTRVAVDFGCCDGIRISNTVYFKRSYGFRRILIEGGGPDRWSNRTEGEKIIYSMVTPENINGLLEQEQCPDVYDLLSLDIDGDDYWVWKAMKKKARVVVLEYMPSIPNQVPLTIKPSQSGVKSYLVKDGTDFKPDELNGYYGANLRAFYNLGKELGYEFVTTVSDNAFFVLAEEYPKLGLPTISREEAIEYNNPIDYWWHNRDKHNSEWVVLDE